MKSKVFLFVLLIFICQTFCACSEQNIPIKEGTYYLANGKNDTYIIISNVTNEKNDEFVEDIEYIGKCDIQFYNYDFMSDNEIYINAAAVMEMSNRFDSEDYTVERLEEIKKKYVELIDLNKQLSENKCEADFVKQENTYYITVTIDGTVNEYDEWGNSLFMRYYPAENEILFNEYKFILE